MRSLLALTALAASAMLLAGCGQHDLDQAADTSTCVKDAHRVPSYPQGFPADFPFPPRTVVFHAQDRGSDGFKQVLATLNCPGQTVVQVLSAASS